MNIEFVSMITIHKIEKIETAPYILITANNDAAHSIHNLDSHDCILILFGQVRINKTQQAQSDHY